MNTYPSFHCFSRRIFLVNSFLFFSGCARTTKECTELFDSNEKMECINKTMFPEVASGAMFGFAAGAVLGGVVAFSTGNPINGGLIVGGIIGGITGGALAYYKFVTDRSNNNLIRAIEDMRQDIKSNSNKIDRMLQASSDALSKIKTMIDTGMQSVKEQITRYQKTNESFLKNQKDTIDVYNFTARKLTVGSELASINEKIDELNRKLNDLNGHIIQAKELLIKNNG